MSGLPTGWESDYDGSRWFYRFKPTGQTQYTFPREGDEFPDYVDELAPVPDLAPEERLESQQQMKRRTTTGSSQDGKASAARAKMRATAGPLGAGMGFGAIGDDDVDVDDGAGFYYQPESFMFLGPGAYNDVSPLADEDDREEVGAKPPEPKGKTPKTTEDAERSSKVSPIQSEATTPLVIKSEPAADSPAKQEPTKTTDETARDVSVVNTPDGQHVIAQPPSPEVHLLDSREMPHELLASTYYSPVGIVAEMPTEATPRAHIETHPDPVEIGDNSVLAPIEIRTAALQTDIAELAERTSPVEPKSLVQSNDELQQTSMSPHLLHQATFGTQARPQGARAPPQTSNAPNMPKALPQSSVEQAPRDSQTSQAVSETRASAPQEDHAFKITRKPTVSGPKPAAYQAYIPGTSAPAVDPMAVPAASSSRSFADGEPREGRRSLEREGSLMIGSTSQASNARNVPFSLQPPRAPGQRGIPSHAEQAPPPPTDPAATQVPNTAASASQHLTGYDKPQEDHLSHHPSVLKPGPRKTPQGTTPPKETTPPPGPVAQGTLHPGYPANYRPLDQSARAYTAPPVQNQLPYPVGTVNPIAARQTQHAALGPRPGMNRVQTEPINPPYPITPQPHRAVPVGQPRDATRQPSESVQSPPVPAKGPPRQQSIAASDVSSLGPSDGQPSGPLQTPSPLDNSRRHSSGFFQNVNQNVSTPSSLSDATSTSQSPFPQNGIPARREIRARSVSSSVVPPPQNGTPAESRPAAAQAPPAIPAKVPLQNEPPRPSPALQQQQQGGAPAERRLSVPSQPPTQGPQFPSQQQAGPLGPNFNAQQVQPVDSGPRFQQNLPIRQQTQQQQKSQVQHQPLPQQKQLQGRPDGVSEQQNADGGGGQPQGRPQRPSVVPPMQQPSRLSMSTPLSPGHLLHAIQESPESEQQHSRFIQQPGIPSNQRTPVVANATQPYPARGPPGPQQFSNSPLAPLTTHGMPPTQRAAGSPMQHRPMVPPGPGQFHQRAMSSPVHTAPQIDFKRDEKKEKSGWLSKLRGSPNKQTVLQKQPPPGIQQQWPPMQHPPFQQPFMQQPPAPFHQNQQAAHSPQHPPGPPHQFQPSQMQQQPWMSAPAQAGPSPDWNRQNAAAAAGTPGRPLSFVAPPGQQGPAPPATRPSLDGWRDVNQAPNHNAPPPMNQQVLHQETQHPVPETQQGGPQQVQTLNRHTSDASTYAASISTVDISEAQAQPMLKGHLVSVRRPGHQRSDSTGVGQQAPRIQSPITGPSGSQFPPQLTLMQSGAVPNGANVNTNPHHVPNTPIDRSMVVPPLFAASKQVTPPQQETDRSYPRDSVVSDVSYQDPRASVVSSFSVQSSEQGGPARRPSASKWVRRPAADYSGEDWPEEEWDRH